METRFFTLLICLITAASCSDKNSLVIDGKVNSDAFEGSKIYIMGPEGANQKYEDSAVIRNGKFTFTMQSDSMDLRTLTIPPKENAAVEDLIFIKERGELDVVMDVKSSSTGTRLNKILMDWKRTNFVYDSTQNDLYYRSSIAGISTADYDSLVRVSALTDSAYLAGVMSMMESYAGNAIGMLFFNMYYDHLPLVLKKSILNKVGDEYMKKDLQIWSKVMFDKDIPKENGVIKK